MARKIDTDANIARVRFAEQGSNPSAPSTGFGYVFEKTDQNLYFMNASGTVSQLAGILASNSKSIASGNKTTTSTTFANVDANLDITLTTGARRCLVIVLANGANSAGGATQLDIEIDSSLQGGTYGLCLTGEAQYGNLSFTFLTTTLSAGSHTFKLFWRVDGNTGTLYCSSALAIKFAVIELPN